jgi:hypothetical protein
MATSYFSERASPASQDALSPASGVVGTPSRGTNALSTRITSVLSASYADLEIRDALETLDARQVRNTAETRRQLRLHVQKEVIQCNGEVVKDFGQVADVCVSRLALHVFILITFAATKTHRYSYQQFKPTMQ